MNDTISALSGGGKRVKVHDSQMVLKLPGEARGLVKQLAAENSVSEANIVRWALAEYFEKRGLGK